MKPVTASPLLLLTWTSPAFPVGAFTYSHGLETAVDDGRVHDAETLAGWVGDLLDHGSLRNDAIVCAAAWRAAADGNAPALQEANDLALAFCAARERYLETTGQGNAFATAIRAAWPAHVPAWPAGDLAYPIAFGSAAAQAGIALSPTLEALGLGGVGNLVSAALRLGAIGQTDGLRITAALTPRVEALAREAAGSSLDDLGGCAQQSDIAAMRHETLYSRLFRS